MHNELKAKWLAGKQTLNGWLSIPSGFSAECMARCDWDSITVDLQHGVQDYQSMVACFQAMEAHSPVPLARPLSNDHGMIGKILDGGAYGVICPMINSREEAEALVDACRYPPQGRRSNGPVRAGLYGGASPYQERANDEILAIAMLETRQAIENFEAIMSVKGLDGVYFGPSDLAFSYGLRPHLDRVEPEIIAIYEQVLDKAREIGLFTGIHTGAASYAARMLKMGFNFATVSSDSNLMVIGAQDVIKSVRGAL